MSATAIGPRWSDTGWSDTDRSDTGQGRLCTGEPTEVIITVRVAVSGSATPGATSRVLREIQEFADRVSAAEVRLVAAGPDLFDPDLLDPAEFDPGDLDRGGLDRGDLDRGGRHPDGRDPGSPSLAGLDLDNRAGGPPPRLRLVPAARVVLLDGVRVQLTRREFDLLLFLCRNRHRVISREELLTEVWQYEWTGGSRTVDVHIRRLRVKLGNAVVSTVHGVGYRVDDRARVAIEPGS